MASQAFDFPDGAYEEPAKENPEQNPTLALTLRMNRKYATNRIIQPVV
jgi:hypothetical protein